MIFSEQVFSENLAKSIAPNDDSRSTVAVESIWLNSKRNPTVNMMFKARI